MRKILLTLLGSALAALPVQAQLFKKPILTGMYLQWGYNRVGYTKSDLHFVNGDQYNFTVHKVKSNDQPDFSGWRTNPLDISIPQYNYRIGFYLNKKHTHAIEINFDHTKYIVTDYQPYNITGQIGGQSINWKDTLLNPQYLHVEHTNGANFFHINYVGQYEIVKSKKRYSPRLTAVWKAGAGVVVPKSDIFLFGKHLDNVFHVAGFVVSGEAGVRFYPARNLFLELTGKGGFADYLNVLTVADGGRIHHNFGYAEGVFTIGYDINFGKYRYKLPNKNKGKEE